MNKIILHGRKVYKGVAEGEAIVTRQPIGFLAGIDPLTGEVTQGKHELKNEKIAGKILVLPYAKGSSGFSKAAYALWLAGNSPKAWIISKSSSQTAMSSIVMRIPTVTALDREPTEIISTGD